MLILYCNFCNFFSKPALKNEILPYIKKHFLFSTKPKFDLNFPLFETCFFILVFAQTFEYFRRKKWQCFFFGGNPQFFPESFLFSLFVLASPFSNEFYENPAPFLVTHQRGPFWGKIFADSSRTQLRENPLPSPNLFKSKLELFSTACQKGVSRVQME